MNDEINNYDFMMSQLWDYDWDEKLIDFHSFENLRKSVIEMLKKNKIKKEDNYFDNIKKRLNIKDEDFISKEEMEI